MRYSCRMGKSSAITAPTQDAIIENWKECGVVSLRPFVHRDAEKEPHQVRVAQILEAVDEASISSVVPPAVCVVPVRMLEAWLLFDEPALRRAAGNPHGQQPLKLPPSPSLRNYPIRKPSCTLFSKKRADSKVVGESGFQFTGMLVE